LTVRCAQDRPRIDAPIFSLLCALGQRDDTSPRQLHLPAINSAAESPTDGVN
jgi:hypothetical protein